MFLKGLEEPMKYNSIPVAKFYSFMITNGFALLYALFVH